MSSRAWSLVRSRLRDGSGGNRWVARACVAGLLAVLCFLAGFSLLTQSDLAGRAARTQRVTRLGQLYADARFWVGQEESLERKYRLEPSAAVLDLHTAAERNLTRDLDAIGHIDGSADTQRLLTHLAREQHLYADASEKMFDAVEQRNTPPGHPLRPPDRRSHLRCDRNRGVCAQRHFRPPDAA